MDEEEHYFKPWIMYDNEFITETKYEILRMTLFAVYADLPNRISCTSISNCPILVKVCAGSC